MKPIKNINPEPLILASASPRRKVLLERLGINLEIIPTDMDESGVKIKEPGEYVKELAYLKAGCVAKVYPHSWVLGADTIVVFQDRILGKPESPAHAREMLKLLSNQKHKVYTGYCLIKLSVEAGGDITIKKSVQTLVTFKSLTEEEIAWYVSTQEPMDKAGAYGIQGIGSFLVKQISGSFTNVVGLPVCEVVEDLLKLKIIELSAFRYQR
jgi:septum formation protein